ncbi:MAG: hypothetical protein ACQESH_03900 [Campylobacterota bacterium]
MNPFIDTLVIGFLILFMVFLIRGYHKMKDYENDDSYLSKEERERLQKEKEQEKTDTQADGKPREDSEHKVD